MCLGLGGGGGGRAGCGTNFTHPTPHKSWTTVDMETTLAVRLAPGWLTAKWTNTESKRTQSQDFNTPLCFALWEPLFPRLSLFGCTAS